MNAILDDECETPVLTNEAIEVHLSYLRPAIEAVAAELPELRKELKALDEKLSGKIEALDARLTGQIGALDERLTGKIEALDERLTGQIGALDERLTGQIGALGTSLNGKIDQANKDRAAGDAMLSEKIDKLADRFMRLEASQNGLKWFIGSLALIASGISITHSLGWI